MSHLKIEILTLFPKMFVGPFQESLIQKAETKGLIQIKIHNLRDFSLDKHQQVDDKPFGGGAGMVLKLEPIFNALKTLGAVSGDGAKIKENNSPWVIYLSPQGEKLCQKKALELSNKNHLILICGHYEGLDERAMDWIDEEISIGDYVLTGGEIPAMVLTDSISRLIPGVVKEWDSIAHDSFFNSMLDYSHYTRPQKFLGKEVPEVLISGNHEEVAKWKKKDSLLKTLKKRADLLDQNYSNEPS